MSSQVRRAILARQSLVFVCTLGWLIPAQSQVDRNIPPNSHYSSGDQGWACNQGFTEVGSLCVLDSDTLPSDNAFEFSDGQWRCRAGYHRSGQYCVGGVAPDHASFVSDGDHWQCDWGFQRVGSQCQEIKPPPHAYLEASGHEWACFPGFQKESDHCVPAPGPAPQEHAAAPPTPAEPKPPQ